MKCSNLLILLASFYLFTSCSMFERRDFIDEMGYEFDQPMFQANRDFMVVPGDTGRPHRTISEINDRTPATYEDEQDFRYKQSLQRELVGLENKLTDAEYEEYLKYKNKLGGTSEKIYYLRLSSAQKLSYLQSRRLTTPKTSISTNRSSFYRSNASANYRRPSGEFPKINDVALGMSKDDVVQNWGQPERRDIAGNPSLENERWAYRKNGSVKYIYFEAGRVEGWTEE